MKIYIPIFLRTILLFFILINGNKFYRSNNIRYFQLDRPEMIDKTLLKSDFIPYRPHSIAGINDTAPFNITISDKMLLLISEIVI